MSVKLETLIAALKAEVHVAGDGARELERAVAGDLLSFVMGSGADGAAWVTIQTHLNVAAVAVLKEIPIIVVASGRKPANDLIERCGEENIALVTAEGSIFDVCQTLGKLGLKG